MNACDCPKPHSKPVAGVGFSAFDVADVDDFATVEPEKVRRVWLPAVVSP